MSDGGFVVVVLSAGTMVGVLAAIVVLWLDGRRVRPSAFDEPDERDEAVIEPDERDEGVNGITVAFSGDFACSWIDVTTFDDADRRYALPDPAVWFTEDGWFGLPDMRQHEQANRALAQNTPPPDVAQLLPTGERAIRVREDEPQADSGSR